MTWCKVMLPPNSMMTVPRLLKPGGGRAQLLLLFPNRDNFISSFLIQMPFITFSCVIVLARASHTVTMKTAHVDIFVLFLILQEKLSGFSFEYVSCGLVIYGLYYVEVHLLHIPIY